jgi:hypothetical protein
MDTTSVAVAITEIGTTFSLAPFDAVLQPLIAETLAEQGKTRWRRGTLLIPGLQFSRRLLAAARQHPDDARFLLIARAAGRRAVAP